METRAIIKEWLQSKGYDSRASTKVFKILAEYHDDLQKTKKQSKDNFLRELEEVTPEFTKEDQTKIDLLDELVPPEEPNEEKPKVRTSGIVAYMQDEMIMINRFHEEIEKDLKKISKKVMDKSLPINVLQKGIEIKSESVILGGFLVLSIHSIYYKNESGIKFPANMHSVKQEILKQFKE